ATILLVGVVELEAFVQAFAGVVQLGAVEVGQALGVDEHLDAAALEFLVFRVGRVRELQLVRQPGAAGGTHAQAHADALAALGKVIRHVGRCAFSQGNRHLEPSSNFPNFCYCYAALRSPSAAAGASAPCLAL